MDIRQIMKGYFVSAEDIVMILNYSGDGNRNSSRSGSVQKNIQAIADRARNSDRYYDLTGGDTLHSLIILRNGAVIGTPFLASTLARNRLRIDASGYAAAGKKGGSKASGRRL